MKPTNKAINANVKPINMDTFFDDDEENNDKNTNTNTNTMSNFQLKKPNQPAQSTNPQLKKPTVNNNQQSSNSSFPSKQ